MMVYVFRSAKDPDVYGFTSYQTGENLPAELEPWRAQGGGAAMPIGNSTDNELLLQTIESEGYYIVHTDQPTWPG
jgi:hypothetical protein